MGPCDLSSIVPNLIEIIFPPLKLMNYIDTIFVLSNLGVVQGVFALLGDQEIIAYFPLVPLLNRSKVEKDLL